MKIKPGLRFCDICLVSGEMNLAIYKTWNANGAQELMIDVCDQHKDFIRDLSPAELNAKIDRLVQEKFKPLDEEVFRSVISKNIKPPGVWEN